MTGGFKEAIEGQVILDDEDPQVVERVVLWLYTGSIYEEEEFDFEDHEGLYCHIAVFAEKRAMPALFNTCIKGTHDYFLGMTKFRDTDTHGRFKVPDLEALRVIYDGSGPGSKLRGFWTAHFVSGRKHSSILTEIESSSDLPQDLLADIIRAILDIYDRAFRRFGAAKPEVDKFLMK